MQKILEKFKDNWFKWLIAGILIILFFQIIAFGTYSLYQHWISAPDLSDLKITEHELINLRSEVGRNRAWLLWMLVSVIGLIAGLYLTLRGRQIQQKQWKTQEDLTLHERYEKASKMLGNELMSVRLAGCHALKQLAKDNKIMWSPCAKLLFAYIKEPYLSNAEKVDLSKKIGNSIRPEDMQQIIYSEDNLIFIFSPGDPLRADIQEAIDSVSAIYQHAYENKDPIKEGIVQLPSYFWKNLKKGEDICFAGGDFTEKSMKEALLFRANFEDATLDKADLTAAYLRNVKNLTKEQILSAHWGTNINGHGIPPALPVELIENDNDIKEWWRMPDYGWDDSGLFWHEEKSQWRMNMAFKKLD